MASCRAGYCLSRSDMKLIIAMSIMIGVDWPLASRKSGPVDCRSKVVLIDECRVAVGFWCI